MADNVDVILRLRNARKFQAEAKQSGKAVRRMGDDMGHVSKRADQAGRSSGKARRGFALLGTAAKTGSLAIGVGLVVGVKKSITAFEESRQVTAQTGAVLKSTGGIANVTAKGVDALGTSLMKKTAIDDEQIKRGANMLLTFTRVRNEVGKGNNIFDQSTKAALDMSVALGTDAKSSALMLGKALNDPAKGLGRLARSGVMFNAQQKKQITTLQESGDMLGAQKIILREVNKEFGGSAAAAKTPLKALKTSAGELFETIGSKLAPALDKGARFLTRFIDGMASGKGAGGAFIGFIKDAAKWVGQLFKSGDGAGALKGAKTVLRDLGTIVTKFVIPAFRAFLPILKGIFSALVQQIRGFVNIVAGVIKVFASLLRGDFRGAWDGVKQIFRGALGVLVGTLRLFTAPFRAAARLLGRVLGGAFRGGWNLIKRVFRAGGRAVVAVLRITTAPARMAARLLIKAITGPFRLIDKLTGGKVRDSLGKIVGFVKRMPGRIAGAAKGMFDGIKNAFKSAVNFIIGAWNGLEFKIPGFDPPGPGPKFGGFTLGVPNIPKLAGGGLLTAGSAFVGERGPELLSVSSRGARVDPLPNVNPVAALAGGLGGDTVVHNSFNVDGKTYERTVTRHARRAQARE